MGQSKLFVVEQYVARLDSERAAAISSRLEEAASGMRADGQPVRLVRTVALTGEESVLCFIDAESPEQALEAGRRAGMHPDHVQEATAVEPCGPSGKA